MTKARVGVILLIVVALGLTTAGIVIAATNTLPVSQVNDPLALNGYPPKSAQVQFVISARQGYQITADVGFNFKTNSLQGQLNVPLAVSDLNLEVRLVNGQLYLGLANMPSVIGSSWVATPLSQPSLYGISLELTKPDISLITGYDSKSVSHSGYSTTYTFQQSHMPNIVVPGGLSNLFPSNGAFNYSITTGSQGEVTGASVHVTAAHSSASIVMTVLSYNKSVNVVAPPASSVKPLGSSGLQKILGNSPLGGILSPGTLTPGPLPSPSQPGTPSSGTFHVTSPTQLN